MCAVATGRVDVVTPCYNAEKFVADTLRSLEAQTLPAWNVTVVDDGSTDGTVEVVAEFVNRDKRVTLVRQPANRGMTPLRNLGARAASSPSTSSFWTPTTRWSRRCWPPPPESLDAHPEVSALCTRHSYIGPAGEDLGAEPGDWPWARCVPSRWWIRMLPGDEPVTPFESIFIVAVMLPSITVMLADRLLLPPAGGTRPSVTVVKIRTCSYGSLSRAPFTIFPASWSTIAATRAR